MVVAITVLGLRGVNVYVWFAFAGAIVALILVYAIASLGREGATPVKLALAGAAVTAGLASVTSGIVMTNVDALDELRFWQVGSLAGRSSPHPCPRSHRGRPSPRAHIWCARPPPSAPSGGGWSATA